MRTQASHAAEGQEKMEIYIESLNHLGWKRPPESPSPTSNLTILADLFVCVCVIQQVRCSEHCSYCSRHYCYQF